MLFGQLGTIFALLMFGASLSLDWALAARFLWGLLNGNIGTSSTLPQPCGRYMHRVCPLNFQESYNILRQVWLRRTSVRFSMTPISLGVCQSWGFKVGSVDW